MTDSLRERLRISEAHLNDINALLLDPDAKVVNAFLDVVAKYGTPEEINRKAEEARQLPSLMARLKEMNSPYVKDLEWLIEQRDKGVFISEADYRERRCWDDYVAAYEDALARCSAEHAPWFVIPSDHKWFRNLAVARILVEHLEGMRMSYPKPTVDLDHIRREYHEATKA